MTTKKQMNDSAGLLGLPLLSFCSFRCFLFFPLLLVTTLTRPARAVEVSLEENRAERGNIGYVDLQLVFRLYPDTQKAKQNFEEVVRQAEDQVNLKKAELLGLRADLARLRVERDYMIKNSPAPPAPTTTPQMPGFENRPPGEVAPSTGAAVAGSTQAAAVPCSTQTAAGAAAVAGSTSAAVAGSTQAAAAPPPVPCPATAASTAPVQGSTEAAPAPLIINLPGIGPEGGTLSPPGGSTTTASAAGNPALGAIDAKIADTSKLLEAKEAEFKTYQAQVEKNLLDLESRRTEILLGRIYAAVKDVARTEGVSVVVDKNQILFGQKAVDLTDKVLDKLKTL